MTSQDGSQVRQLRDSLLDHLDRGEPMDTLTVLTSGRDPFRLATPANHAMAAYVRDLFVEHNVVKLHTRGTHYLAVGGKPHPVSKGVLADAYANDEPTWEWMQRAVKAARWLLDPATGAPYLSFDSVNDERNDEPVLNLYDADTAPEGEIATGFDAEIDVIEIGRPTARLDDEVVVNQPYRILLWGEKSSLAPLLADLARLLHADYCVGSGETSDTILHTLAALAARDGRPLVVIIVSDFDPSGWQMPISIGHKLRALREFLYPDIGFYVVHAGVTAAHVIDYGLPSSVIKEEEKRKGAWKDAWGIEQTEVDAMLARRPAELRQAILDAAEPYFDGTLETRLRQAEEEWEEEAQALVDAAIDASRHAELAAAVDAARNALIAAVEAARSEIEAMVATVALPAFEPPEADASGPDGEALVSSEVSFREHVETLRAYRRYEI